MNKLFAAFDLHGLKLANHIVMAPMTRSRASADNVPAEIAAEYYRQRSSAGLIVTEATAVSKQGCGYPNIPGIWNEVQTTAWKQITKSVHDAGGKLFLQIFHTGRIAHSSLIHEQPVSSSAKTPTGEVMAADYSMKPYEQPRPLSISEMPSIVKQFQTAAKNALAAGFDGIEIHAANGYLIDQFLRDGANIRQDNYGGSIENRARLLLEICRATLEVFGKQRVGVRLSPHNPFNSMSDSNPLQTFTTIARLLNDLPLAYLHTVEPLSSTPWVTASIRKVFQGVLIANGALTKDAGEKLLQEKAADLVCYGMPFIANPDLVERFNKNLPLAAADPATLYGGGAKGYTDYPKVTK